MYTHAHAHTRVHMRTHACTHTHTHTVSAAGTHLYIVSYKQWVCPFIYTLPHKAQFFTSNLIQAKRQHHPAGVIDNLSISHAEKRVINFNILNTDGTNATTVNTDTDLQVTTDESNRWACQCDCWSKWVVFGCVSTLGATTDLCKCFLYIPENWYQNHHVPLIKGIWFCTQPFSPVTNVFVTASVGLDPLWWMALALYMRSEREAGMLACIDAEQWTYLF